MALFNNITEVAISNSINDVPNNKELPENNKAQCYSLSTCQISSPDSTNATIGWLPSPNKPEPERMKLKTGEWILTTQVPQIKSKAMCPITRTADIHYIPHEEISLSSNMTKSESGNKSYGNKKYLVKSTAETMCHDAEYDVILDKCRRPKSPKQNSSSSQEEFLSDHESTSDDYTAIDVDEMRNLTAKIRRSNRIARPVYDPFIDQQVRSVAVSMHKMFLC